MKKSEVFEFYRTDTPPGLDDVYEVFKDVEGMPDDAVIYKDTDIYTLKTKFRALWDTDNLSNIGLIHFSTWGRLKEYCGKNE